MNALKAAQRRRLILLAVLLTALLAGWAVWVNTAARYDGLCAGLTAANPAERVAVVPFCRATLSPGE